METSVRLHDADNKTCLALADVDLYTLDTTSRLWSPQSQYKCFLSGLIIRKSVPHGANTSFTVTITGQHLVCSTSHFEVAMRQTKRSACELAGDYRRCVWSDAVESATLTTCVAECRCVGDDCSHVTIRIPKMYRKWQICEISIQ